ncbi:MAG: hypothetical protein H6621_10615 [Halobacteriovoraceae bacterium]|nr:hypothetical protein [Halobacteriovoraceae bacterium]MCB9095509.1 hypothetical protein [Halobacteriovoraceae bacterium]
MSVRKFKGLSLLGIGCLLFSNCSKDDPTFRKFKPVIEKLEVKGCLHQYAENLEIKSNLEDGSCIFNHCLTEGYAEFDEKISLSITDYLERFGENFKDKPRVNPLACVTPLYYCEHPDALNYVPGPYPPKGYLSELCEFIACDDQNFEGYQKYLEILEFLKTHKGNIAIDNSTKYCGDQLVFKVTKQVPVDVKNADYTQARLSFILDDSASMDDEIDDIKTALVNLAPTFISLGADIDLNFYRMSEVDTLVKKIDPQNNPRLYRYTLPKPIGEVKVNKNSQVNQVSKELKKILNDFEIVDGFANEEGLCLTMRHLNDIISDGFAPKTRYVSIVLTDEDEHYKNNTNNCPQSFEADSPNGFMTKITPYQDKNGVRKFTSAFTDMVMGLTPEQLAAYGWLGLFYDEQSSKCLYGESHGATYLQFADTLKTYNVPYAVGDICSKDYTKMIYDKLIKGFLDTVNLKYFFFKYYKAPEVNAVYLVDFNGNKTLVDKNDYTIVQDGEEYSILFEMIYKDTVRTFKEIEVDFTYYK